MSKWTPGPWVHYVDAPSIDPTWHIVTTANKMRVIANVHIEPGNAVDEANARLIAAAPDLVEALEAMLGADLWADAEGAAVSFSRTSSLNDGEAFVIAERSRAALKKARGEA